jgi:hypothetical protein
MTNYILMWQRGDNEGFDFVNAKDTDSAIHLWLDGQSGPHPDGELFKLIITETNDTYKIPLDVYGYYYGEFI